MPQGDVSRSPQGRLRLPALPHRQAGVRQELIPRSPTISDPLKGEVGINVLT